MVFETSERCSNMFETAVHCSKMWETTERWCCGWRRKEPESEEESVDYMEQMTQDWEKARKERLAKELSQARLEKIELDNMGFLKKLRVWVSKLRNVNCLPAAEIEDAYEALLEQAYVLFNNGVRRKGRGPVGNQPASVMHVAWSLHHKIGSIYINGTHSSVEALSWFERERRNNNGMEASHNQTILLGETSTKTVRGSFERWRDVAAVQERFMNNREFELLQPDAKPRVKHWTFLAHDKRIETYKNKYARKELTQEQYWQKIIDCRAHRGLH